MFSCRYQRLTGHWRFILMSGTTDRTVSLQSSPFVHYSDKIIELLWPHNCEWVSSLLCSNGQNWLNQTAYVCDRRCVWMLFFLCFDQNKVKMCVRPGLCVTGQVTCSRWRGQPVAHVLTASLQMWWMEALCIWRTSGSSPIELHADVILLCVMWSPPWQRIKFQQAANRVLDRNLHVSAWALIQIHCWLSFPPLLNNRLTPLFIL